MPELNAWWIVGAIVFVLVSLWWCIDAVKQVPLPAREDLDDDAPDLMQFVEPTQWDHI